MTFFHRIKTKNSTIYMTPKKNATTKGAPSKMNTTESVRLMDFKSVVIQTV
jgi:hypothetical protein